MTSNKLSPHHTSLAELAISYIRSNTGRILSGGHAKNAEEAILSSMRSYNLTKQKLLANYAPAEISIDNIAEVLAHQNQHRLDIWAKYRNAYPRYKIHDFVRLRLSHGNFQKINEPTTSKDVFEITGIKQTMPTPSYILQSVSTSATLPGSVTFDKIVLATDYSNNNGDLPNHTGNGESQ